MSGKTKGDDLQVLLETENLILKNEFLKDNKELEMILEEYQK